MKGLGYTALLCMVVGCSLTPQVVAKYDAKLHQVIVTGCKVEPEVKLGLEVASMFYPPSAAIVTIADAEADKFCEKVRSLQVNP